MIRMMHRVGALLAAAAVCWLLAGVVQYAIPDSRADYAVSVALTGGQTLAAVIDALAEHGLTVTPFDNAQCWRLLKAGGDTDKSQRKTVRAGASGSAPLAGEKVYGYANTRENVYFMDNFHRLFVKKLELSKVRHC